MKKILLILILYAFAQMQLNAQDYQLKKHVFGSSAETKSNSSYTLKGTAGQSVIGLTSSTDYKAGLGYWYDAELDAFYDVQDMLEIPLAVGWQMISSNIITENDSVKVISADIQDNMVIMKNPAGAVFIPSIDLDNIVFWNITHGYSVFLTQPDTLRIYGTFFKPEETPITVSTGWTTLSYLRNSPMNPVEALESVTEDDELIIAKNSAGQIYIPSVNVNTIGTMYPGQGYQMFFSTNATLTYPANNGAGKIAGGGEYYITAGAHKLIPEVSRTGNSMTLLIDYAGKNGTEIGAYSASGVLIGSGAVYNNLAAITVWGKNSMLDDCLGAEPSEEITLKVLNDFNNETYEISAKNVLNFISNEPMADELLYNEDAVYRISIDSPTDYTASLSIYPNPVQDEAILTMLMPEEGRGSIVIYNALGSEVLKLKDISYSQGTNTFNIKTSNIPTGDYYVIARAGEVILRERFIVFR